MFDVLFIICLYHHVFNLSSFVPATRFREDLSWRKAGPLISWKIDASSLSLSLSLLTIRSFRRVDERRNATALL